MSSIAPKKLKEKHFKIKDKVSGYDKDLVLKTFQLPNGMTENFFIDKGKDSVQIFALTKDQQVICVRQFRAGQEQIQTELPGGGLESGEDPKKAAERELAEETGFTTRSEFVCLGKIPYSPYWTGHKNMFLATECEKTTELSLDPNEFLEVVEIPIEKFRKLMQTGQVRGFDTAYLALDKMGRLEETSL